MSEGSVSTYSVYVRLWRDVMGAGVINFICSKMSIIGTVSF